MTGYNAPPVTGYSKAQNSGVDLPERTVLDFTQASDDAVGGKTLVDTGLPGGDPFTVVDMPHPYLPAPATIKCAIFHADDFALAFAEEGDAWPRILMAHRGDYPFLFMGDGTVNPYLAGNGLAFGWDGDPPTLLQILTGLAGVGIRINTDHMKFETQTESQMFGGDWRYEVGTAPVLTCTDNAAKKARITATQDGTLHVAVS